MRRRALLLGVPGSGLNVTLAMERLGPVLERMGFAVAKLVGRRATRVEILRQLDRLVRSSEPGDAAVVYYFGHGGRVRFPDLPPPWGEHVFGYVTCHRELRGGPWEAVLDQELSTRLTALDSRCGNVTAILDCCFSGELVRDVAVHPSDQRTEPASEWVTEALAPKDGAALALDSHPGIVRLCGASSKREAFAVERSGRHIGRLTEALLAVLDEAGEAWPSLCWATAGPRIREHVIEALSMEGQWVNVAGPRARRLFSARAVPVPGVVPAVPAEEPGRLWLRAGWQQAVGEGDRWAVLSTLVDDDGKAAVIAEGTVASVGRNRAELVLDGGGERAVPSGSPAVPLAVSEPMPVDVPSSMIEAVRASAWLEPVGEGVSVRVVEQDSTLAVEQEGRPSLRLVSGEQGRAQALAVLEDRARRWALQRSLAAQSSSSCPVRWSWRRVDDPEPLPEAGAVLAVGDRIRIDLSFEGAAPLPWFVAVILVDPAGRLHLLSARMPEGLEIGPGHRETVGARPGRRDQGIELRWPEGLAPEPGPAQVLVLASRRPQCLEHLATARALDHDAALALQGLAAETERGSKPEHARGAAWASFDFVLDPSPRSKPP